MLLSFGLLISIYSNKKNNEYITKILRILKENRLRDKTPKNNKQ